MSHDPIVLRALTAEEVDEFRQALIDDLRAAATAPPDKNFSSSMFFPDGMRWNYGDVLSPASAYEFSGGNNPPEEVSWCGTVGCAMGRMPAIPAFAKEGFGVEFYRTGGLWRPCGVTFQGRVMTSRAGAHFLGVSVGQFTEAFWAATYGRLPINIADWLAGLPPAEAQAAGAVVGFRLRRTGYGR